MRRGALESRRTDSAFDTTTVRTTHLTAAVRYTVLTRPVRAPMGADVDLSLLSATRIEAADSREDAQGTAVFRDPRHTLALPRVHRANGPANTLAAGSAATVIPARFPLAVGHTRIHDRRICRSGIRRGHIGFTGVALHVGRGGDIIGRVTPIRRHADTLIADRLATALFEYVRIPLGIAFVDLFALGIGTPASFFAS